MKKTINFFVIACALLFTLTLTLSACGRLKGSEGLEFASNGDGTCTVIGIGKCTDTEIVIPSKHEGDNVTSIRDLAFSKSHITSVTIPRSVTSIGIAAFSSCSNLTSIAIPDSVTSIGGDAFYDCGSLTSIVVDGNNKHYSSDSGVLYNKDKTELCAYPTASGSYTVPYGVTKIGSGAFRGCGALTSITIPDSVTSIGGSAFSTCNSLKNITVDAGNTVYHSDGNCLVETASKTLIAGCQSSIIPTDGSVTSIGERAFDFCHNLTSVTIPDSVTSIGSSVFNSCINLTSVTIPDSVTSIGDGAFWFCSSLTSVTIPNGVISIDAGTFYNCSSLKSITIPDSVTSIGDLAFNNCINLTSITIPDSVTSIGQSAFAICSNLTNITFEGTMAQWEVIEKKAYWNYGSDKYIVHCNDGDIDK